MKFLVTLYNNRIIKELEDADGFLIGNERFGARLTHSFSVAKINEAIALAKKYDKEIFLVANQILNDYLLEEFELWLKDINVAGLTGIIVADLGAFHLLKRIGLVAKTIYNPETLMTNYYDFNFLASEGIKGVFVAKEITLEDIKMIGDKKQTQLFMVGHGHLNMFYSKRQLINNFMDYNHLKNELHNKQNLKIIEEKRTEEPYPILEDMAGTHVFRSNVFHSNEHLDELQNYVDYLVIDTIFKDSNYAKYVLALYKNHPIITENEIKEKYNETWDDGFFYKKTVYKQKGASL